MLSERLQLKMYLEPTEHFELEALIPVFHRFIRDSVLKELLIDVVDYSHVPDGPGVVLIGHAADYYFGALDGSLGLVYSRKRAAPPPEVRLEDALRHVVNAARLLEREPPLKLHFRTSELSLRLTDRLNAPNDEPTFSAAKQEAEQLFSRVYGGEATVERAPSERVSSERAPLALVIRTSVAPALEALLERLGGPPTE